jgi:hypothetical protein
MKVALAMIAMVLAGFGISLAQGIPAQRDDGYRGIWYSNQPSNDEYKFKYSGGLGTYTADHIPLAYYSKEADKTYFCWGGSAKEKNRLIQMVSYYDHATGEVPRPVILMDKKTDDAHDNPTIMLDDDGYIWIFVSAHGTVRPSFIYKSGKPYSIDSFTLIRETNFSYPQPWWIPGKGFLFLHTRYLGGRFLYWSTSPDGMTWSEPQQLAAVAQGHYQVSWIHGTKVGTAFNYHPSTASGNWTDPTDDTTNAQFNGLNYRTNLYYLETADYGKTWRTATGERIAPPLTDIRNPALVHDYAADGLLVYIMDMGFDADGRPVILYLTSKGYEAGPKNAPRTWRTAHWTGKSWDIRPVTTSNCNYDMGSIYIEPDGVWRIIGPTGMGPQQYNPGGEVAVWTSRDRGRTWEKTCQVTSGSPYNHSYVRKPVNAHPDFYGFWADGHGRELSPSRLYFCDKTGEKAYRLPETMKENTAQPARMIR